MHLIMPESVLSYSFEEGYAGELAWSPDGKHLAISTYSPDRTQHEIYMMNLIDGPSAPRHLLDGCKIAWSPDGQFIAVKREPHDATGVSAIRVDSGYNWLITEQPALIPIAWGVDREDALARSAEPVPYAIQLGK
jgi:dipeptidyl aminopeptidase/acylaminoacyl peptidase